MCGSVTPWGLRLFKGVCCRSSERAPCRCNGLSMPGISGEYLSWPSVNMHPGVLCAKRKYWDKAIYCAGLTLVVCLCVRVFWLLVTSLRSDYSHVEETKDWWLPAVAPHFPLFLVSLLVLSWYVQCIPWHKGFLRSLHKKIWAYYAQRNYIAYLNSIFAHSVKTAKMAMMIIHWFCFSFYFLEALCENIRISGLGISMTSHFDTKKGTSVST